MKRLAVITSLFAMFLLWRISGATAQTQFEAAGVERFKAAVEAPDFALSELGGGRVSLKDMKGKVVVLNFFATY